MQKNHYKNDFRPKLVDHGKRNIDLSIDLNLKSILGYDSVYIKRSGDKSDGCCLFYRRDRLKLIDSKTVPFYQKNIQILDR